LAAEIVYVDEPYLLVGRHIEFQCLHSQWRGFATSAEFRAGGARLLAAIKETSSTALVSDTRELELVASEDQLWIRDTWLPLAAAAGLKRVALLVAPQGLGRFAIDQMRSQVRSQIPSHGQNAAAGLVSRQFDSLDEARKWADSSGPGEE
jgi:hypothetical protein